MRWARMLLHIGARAGGMCALHWTLLAKRVPRFGRFAESMCCARQGHSVQNKLQYHCNYAVTVISGQKKKKKKKKKRIGAFAPIL